MYWIQYFHTASKAHHFTSSSHFQTAYMKRLNAYTVQCIRYGETLRRVREQNVFRKELLMKLFRPSTPCTQDWVVSRLRFLDALLLLRYSDSDCGWQLPCLEVLCIKQLTKLPNIIQNKTSKLHSDETDQWHRERERKRWGWRKAHIYTKFMETNQNVQF